VTPTGACEIGLALGGRQRSQLILTRDLGTLWWNSGLVWSIGPIPNHLDTRARLAITDGSEMVISVGVCTIARLSCFAMDTPP